MLSFATARRDAENARHLAAKVILEMPWQKPPRLKGYRA